MNGSKQKPGTFYDAPYLPRVFSLDRAIHPQVDYGKRRKGARGGPA